MWLFEGPKGVEKDGRGASQQCLPNAEGDKKGISGVKGVSEEANERKPG